MAAFDSTLGGSAATSYITLDEANEFFQFGSYEDQWTALSDDDKRAALIQATFYLDALKYKGDRCNPSTDDENLPQALSWPRSGARCDGVEAMCGSIPRQIKQATAFLALNLSVKPDAIDGPIGGEGGGTPAGVYVSSKKLGDLQLDYAAFPSSSEDNCNDCNTPPVINKFKWLEPLLGCWAKDWSTNSRVLLRVRS